MIIYISLIILSKSGTFANVSFLNSSLLECQNTNQTVSSKLGPLAKDEKLYTKCIEVTLE